MGTYMGMHGRERLTSFLTSFRHLCLQLLELRLDPRSVRLSEVWLLELPLELVALGRER